MLIKKSTCKLVFTHAQIDNYVNNRPASNTAWHHYHHHRHHHSRTDCIAVLYWTLWTGRWRRLSVYMTAVTLATVARCIQFGVERFTSLISPRVITRRTMTVHSSSLYSTGAARTALWVIAYPAVGATVCC